MTTEPRPLPPHTPGPWREGGVKEFLLNNKCREIVADDGKIGLVYGITDEDNKANAALIARAPELAARVEELTEDIADHKQIIEDKRERNKELRAHNARLRGLLRECVEFLPMALQATIYEELGQ